jgi:putative SOS response-associated peptidase YedK
MCGRFNLRTNPHDFAEIFAVIRSLHDADLKPRYNIAPTQTIPIVRGQEGEREAVETTWGFTPQWSKAVMINAKCETVATLRTFSKAFRERRCLIPASGFYEWEKREDEEFSTILTTSPNSMLARVHDRRPVILHPDDYAAWLADGELPEKEAARLFEPFPPMEMKEATANPAMNNARFEGPDSLVVPKNSE